MKKEILHKRKIISKTSTKYTWSMTYINLCQGKSKDVIHRQKHFWKDVNCEHCLNIKALGRQKGSGFGYVTVNNLKDFLNE